jgi:hypothetical protein
MGPSKENSSGVGGVRVIQSSGSLFWVDEKPEPVYRPPAHKKEPLVLEKKPLHEVFFQNQRIVGITIPKEILKRSLHGKALATGMCHCRTDKDNTTGITVGKPIFGSVDNVKAIFVISSSRILAFTELGSLYAVFVDEAIGESYAPTTIHSGLVQEGLTPAVLPLTQKSSEKTLFLDQHLQIFRLTGDLWKFPKIGTSGQFVTDKPLAGVPPRYHNGLTAGLQVPGAKVGGFVSSVFPVDHTSACAITRSGALYFILAV